MPLYEYECEKCGKRVEKIEKYDGPHVKKCPSCGGHLDRLLSAPAIQFKGSGWYVTDYGRSSAKESAPDPGNKDPGNKDGGSQDSAAKENKESGNRDAGPTGNAAPNSEGKSPRNSERKSERSSERGSDSTSSGAKSDAKSDSSRSDKRKSSAREK